MVDKNQQQADFRGPENDALDHTLDAALAMYASVEPRAGLEDRVLANLRAEPRQTLRPRFWHWTAAVAMAAVLIAVAGVLRWKSRTPPVETTQRPPTTTLAAQPRTNIAPSENGNGVHLPHRVVSRALSHSRPSVAIATPPKLEHFPSPQPLSEQERILADYVAQFQDQAVLVARARMESLRRDQADNAEPSLGRETSN